MNYHKLKEHLGHDIIIVGYREEATDPYAFINIECLSCDKVISSYEDPELL